MSGQQGSPSRSPPPRSQPPKSAAETMMRWELLKVLTGVRDHRLDPSDVVEKLMAAGRSGELGDLFMNGPLDAHKMENVEKALHALASEQGEPEKQEMKHAQQSAQGSSGLKPLSLPTRVDSTPASPPQRDGSVRRQGSVRSAKVRYRSSGDGHTLGSGSAPLNAPSTPPANVSRTPSGSPGMPQGRPAGSSPPTSGQTPAPRPQASGRSPGQPNTIVKDPREQPMHQKAPTAASMAGQHPNAPTQGQVPPKSATNQPQQLQAPLSGPQSHQPAPNAQGSQQPMSRSNAQRIPPPGQQQAQGGKPPTNAQHAASNTMSGQHISPTSKPAHGPVPVHPGQQPAPPERSPMGPPSDQTAPQRPIISSRSAGTTPPARPGSQQSAQSGHPPGAQLPPSQRPAVPQAQQFRPSGSTVGARPNNIAASSKSATAQPNRAPAGQSIGGPQSHEQRPNALQPNAPEAVSASQKPGAPSSSLASTQQPASMHPPQQAGPMGAQPAQSQRPASAQAARHGMQPMTEPGISAQGMSTYLASQQTPIAAQNQRPRMSDRPTVSQHQPSLSQSSVSLRPDSSSEEKFAESKSVIDFDSSSESNDLPTPETHTETGSTGSDETLLVEDMAAEAADIAHGIELVEGDFTPEEMFDMFLAGKLPKDWSSEQNTGSAVKLMSLGALYASQAYLGKGGRKIAVEVANSMGVFL